MQRYPPIFTQKASNHCRKRKIKSVEEKRADKTLKDAERWATVLKKISQIECKCTQAMIYMLWSHSPFSGIFYLFDVLAWLHICQMDRYTEIRDELDKSCEQMDMKSATIHSNEFGKTYTIRFKYGRPNSGSNERSNHSANTEHRTFVISERSEYQMNRNRIRANLFKFSHPGRNYYDKTEKPRNCDRSTR